MWLKKFFKKEPKLSDIELDNLVFDLWTKHTYIWKCYERYLKIYESHNMPDSDKQQPKDGDFLFGFKNEEDVIEPMLIPLHFSDPPSLHKDHETFKQRFKRDAEFREKYSV